MNRARRVIGIGGIVGLAVSALWMARTSSGGAYLLQGDKGTQRLEACVLGYERHREFSGALLYLTIPAGRRLTLQRGDPAMLQIVAETPQGWIKANASTLGPTAAPWNLEPGAINVLTLAVPADATRWKLVFSAREAGLRERVARELMTTRSWARNSTGSIRPAIAWCIRRLPNRAGRSVHFDSDVFDVRTTRSLRPHKGERWL